MVVVTGQRGKREFRRLVRLFSIGVGLALVFAGGGFLAFVNQLDQAPERPQRTSDGIVVLTGGADRIIDAMELLAEGYGKRLLITGVHKETTRRQLRHRVRKFAKSFDCCVDLGHEARDTAGNAQEAADWARQHQMRSVILVTSSYHMPRARLEMRHAAADLQVRPFAVSARNIHIERWWAYPGTFRLLMSEYAKWIEAMIRTSGIGDRGDDGRS